jgi:hypothetical protein
MTNTYLIHAWCVRPFIAYLDEVEAATPEEAIAIARRRPETLLDNAEESNGQYPWDEFAAYDEQGNEVLVVLDHEARLRKAAPELLQALERAVNAQGNHRLKHSDGMVQDLTPAWVSQARAVIASICGRR